jgi:hypothetical protein
MAANDVYRVVIRGRLFGSEIDNVLWFRERAGSSVGAGNNSAALAANVRTGIDTVWRAPSTTSMGFEAVQATRMVPYGDGPYEDAWAANTVGGGGSGTAIHPATAAVLTLYTSKIGRSRRGRIYYCGINGTQAASGLWGSTIMTQLTAIATTLTARYGVGGSQSWELGVWSRKLAGPDPPFDPTAFEPITSIAVRAQLRSQRRRQVGVGR